MATMKYQITCWQQFINKKNNDNFLYIFIIHVIYTVCRSNSGLTSTTLQKRGHTRVIGDTLTQ